METPESHAVINHEGEQEQIGARLEGRQTSDKDAGQTIDGGVHQLDRRQKNQSFVEVHSASQQEGGATNTGKRISIARSWSHHIAPFTVGCPESVYRVRTMLGSTDRALTATGSAIAGCSHMSSRGGNQPVANSVPDTQLNQAESPTSS
jgi:hypothetical protein